MGVEQKDLDDLSQQIMLKLWKKLPTFDYDPQLGSFRSWLCTIVRNTVYNHFRDNKSNDVASFNTEKINPELEKLFENEWMIHISNLAIRAVRDNFSPAVWDIYSRVAKGESAEDIAAELGLELVSDLLGGHR